MPELPEVETVCQGLNRFTLHQEITGVDVLLKRTIAYPDDPIEFTKVLEGQTIIQWHRRGKYLVATLKDSWLAVHLKMTGQLLWVDPAQPLEKHTRIRLFFGSQRELRFVDQRSFGHLWCARSNTPIESIIKSIKSMGPEPLGSEYTITYLKHKLKNRQRSIKTLLLDQNMIAGLGNIYVDEVLFKSQIHPETKSDNLTDSQIESLYQAIIDILQQAIAQGGTTFSHYLNVEGVNGNYGRIAYVYNREDQPCRVCATPIIKIKLNGRGTHFCPQCQVK